MGDSGRDQIQRLNAIEKKADLALWFLVAMVGLLVYIALRIP